ncbi:sensor histidine kinase-like protein/response regulator [Amniculicola lignicola CBS 123094]|uniref:Sensor histidine kinase-like protein/response regulator n=1 Tax=Amniculicola lignicola CBS 123094 TaxID=1392246 RepID=A0A6A5W937_9PLEO|nr:sensor histidine kinase-like protein/response regulator [Amniculicola lignicola CBS 123094]
MDTHQPAAPHEFAIPSARADVEDRAKEREFYRYYHQSRRLKGCSGTSTPQSSRSSAQPNDVFSITPSIAVASDDKALTAFAQLGAFRLNTRRCIISFFDRKNCYILAEATQTLSLQTGLATAADDRLQWGTTVFPKEASICYYTVNMPLIKALTAINDLPVLVVPDLSADPRFNKYPSVSGLPFSRFYAGVPIASPSGHRIGTYCVIDDKPRARGVSEDELAFLKDMAWTVMRHLEMSRAMDEHRRGEIMVSSLGSFAEGKPGLEEQWQENTRDYETNLDAVPESMMEPRQRRKSMSSRTKTSELTELKKLDASDHSTPTIQSAGSASPFGGIVSSVDHTPASSTAADDQPSEATPRPGLSTENSLSSNQPAPEIKATFTRAANMIVQATEADGVVFFDAKVSTFGALVDDDFLEGLQLESSGRDKLCAVLGTALGKSARDLLAPEVHFSMFEGVLRHLLRTYPHGQIFNFDQEVASATQSTTDLHSPPSTPKLESVSFHSLRRPDATRSQDDEHFLRDVFPKAQSIVLYPLWDPRRNRWFAGAIIWSSDPMRVFTSEQELSYLAAFSNSAMAEVARIDTKLADAAKGDFISSISHELRSPLHGILGSCELLKDTQLDTFQTSMAQTVETCGKTLLETINHVLDFAKINNLTRGGSRRARSQSQVPSQQVINPGKGHLNDIMTLISDVDLAVLAGEVLDTVFAGYNFQRSATQTFDAHHTNVERPDVAVILDINKSDSYVFRTQPGAWRRVLMNLFGNALKYTPAGYIKVKLQLTPGVGNFGDCSELRLTIVDSGIGMGEDYVNNRLFHSFAQENPLSQGTGLGLSIVKQIIESLGGDIDVRSEKGLGTKFTVRCPLKLSTLSPVVCSSLPERQVLSITQKTAGMTVSFIGFEKEAEYFPIKKSLKNKTASFLAVKALEHLCADWFGMKVHKQGTTNDQGPDLYMATESGAQWLRTEHIKDTRKPSTVPVIVVCQGAASAHSTAAITTNPGQTIECIAQPCGPHKLAKALTSCLERHAKRLDDKSTETDSALSSVERLSLQENLSPVNPKTFDHLIASSRPNLAMHALSAPAIPSASPQNVGTTSHNSLNCLAVDDNPINLRLLRTFINKLRHRHDLAVDGLQTVNVFKAASISPDPATHFDVVLMDINMPIMDGLEATRQIRAYEREKGIKPTTIIALTGLASLEAQQEAHVSGVNLFLIKPVRLAELEVVLKGVVTGMEKMEETSAAAVDSVREEERSKRDERSTVA